MPPPRSRSGSRPGRTSARSRGSSPGSCRSFDAGPSPGPAAAPRCFGSRSRSRRVGGCASSCASRPRPSGAISRSAAGAAASAARLCSAGPGPKTAGPAVAKVRPLSASQAQEHAVPHGHCSAGVVLHLADGEYPQDQPQEASGAPKRFH